jgi:protein O-mannosyl-transferase
VEWTRYCGGQRRSPGDQNERPANSCLRIPSFTTFDGNDRWRAAQEARKKGDVNGQRSQANKALPCWIAPAIIALVTFAVFLPVLRNQLLFDDVPNLIGNPHYRGLGWTQLQWMFTTVFNGHYRPLTWVTLGFDYLIWEMDPFGYHLANIAIHGVNAVLFFFVAQRLIARALPHNAEGESWQLTVAAAFAALVFSVHPLRVEVVAMATDRKESLAAFFFLGTVWLYLQDRIKPAVCLYALSLLSKASAIMLPVALLVLDKYPMRRPGLQLRNKIPFVLLSIPFGIVALVARGEVGEFDLPDPYTISDRLAQAVYVPGYWAWRTFVVYNVLPRFDSSSMLMILICALTVVLSIAFYLLRKKYPAPLACWLFMIVMLGPVLGIVQRGQIVVADRYSYVACLPLALLAAGLLYRILQGSVVQRRSEKRRNQRAAVCAAVKAAVSMAVIVLVVVGSLSWQKTFVWRTNETLRWHWLAVAPTAAFSHYGVADILIQQGKYEKGIEHLRRALKAKPTWALPHSALANVLTRQNKLDEALTEFQIALLLRPEAPAYSNLGQMHAIRGELEQAIQAFEESLKLRPDHGPTQADLGNALSRRNKPKTWTSISGF